VGIAVCSPTMVVDLSSKPLPLTRVIFGRCPRPPKPFFPSGSEWLGEEEE